jgi:hypothetical protein
VLLVIFAVLLARIRNETLCMVEKCSGSGSSTADTDRDLERERTKNAQYSFVDSSEGINTVESGEFGETSAGEGGTKTRFGNDDNHDEEASGASSCEDEAEEDSAADDEEEEEEEDWFAETKTYRDMYSAFEEDADAALEKELDEQMEAMWGEYSDDIHDQIQNELDQALQQQLDEQFEHFNESYSNKRVELNLRLEEDWDLQPDDECKHEHSSRCRGQHESEELVVEPSSTRRFARRFPVEHKSSVESINALIQQVADKYR